MPFAAFCKKCEHYIIGDNLLNIGLTIAKHFEDNHDELPDPNPYFLNWSDFEGNLVELDRDDTAGTFSFTSRLFCSDDYCVAVVTHNNYRSCKRILDMRPPEEQQKYLSVYLCPYFL